MTKSKEAPPETNMRMYLNFQEGQGKEPKLDLSQTRYEPRNTTVS